MLHDIDERSAVNRLLLVDCGGNLIYKTRFQIVRFEITLETRIGNLTRLETLRHLKQGQPPIAGCSFFFPLNKFDQSYRCTWLDLTRIPINVGETLGGAEVSCPTENLTGGELWDGFVLNTKITMLTYERSSSGHVSWCNIANSIRTKGHLICDWIASTTPPEYGKEWWRVVEWTHKNAKYCNNPVGTLWWLAILCCY